MLIFHRFAPKEIRPINKQSFAPQAGREQSFAYIILPRISRSLLWRIDILYSQRLDGDFHSVLFQPEPLDPNQGVFVVMPSSSVPRKELKLDDDVYILGNGGVLGVTPISTWSRWSWFSDYWIKVTANASNGKWKFKGEDEKRLVIGRTYQIELQNVPLSGVRGDTKERILGLTNFDSSAYCFGDTTDKWTVQKAPTQFANLVSNHLYEGDYVTLTNNRFPDLSLSCSEGTVSASKTDVSSKSFHFVLVSAGAVAKPLHTT